jgi:hypothetical protein
MTTFFTVCQTLQREVQGEEIIWSRWVAVSQVNEGNIESASHANAIVASVTSRNVVDI